MTTRTINCACCNDCPCVPFGTDTLMPDTIYIDYVIPSGGPCAPGAITIPLTKTIGGIFDNNWFGSTPVRDANTGLACSETATFRFFFSNPFGVACGDIVSTCPSLFVTYSFLDCTPECINPGCYVPCECWLSCNEWFPIVSVVSPYSALPADFVAESYLPVCFYVRCYPVDVYPDDYIIITIRAS